MFELIKNFHYSTQDFIFSSTQLKYGYLQRIDTAEQKASLCSPIQHSSNKQRHCGHTQCLPYENSAKVRLTSPGRKITMPKTKEVSNHPCHLLSLPSAKRFWCRHCMTVFEDAITRWHHSRSCRYGVVNNFMRRRELEAKALQNTSVLNPVEARLEHSIQMSDLASRSVTATTSRQEPVNLPDQDSFTCFICHQKFLSMEEMRMHVKFPCSNSKIITSHVPHPKHSVPVFIDAMPVRQQWQQHLQSQEQIHQNNVYRQAHNYQVEQGNINIDIKSEQEVETHYDTSTLNFTRDNKNTTETITPTNIYVNEQGETVIEVENLDLNTEGAELSLAHLLTQLSQQGIVFDKTRTAELQCKQEISVNGESNILYTTETAYEEVIKDDEEQPTAEDAANTLAQLAGFRSFRNHQPTYDVSSSDEKPMHTVESYNYSDYIAGPSLVSSQSEMNITYRYEYSEPNEQCEETNTGQVGGLEHCKSTDSLTYQSDKNGMDSGEQINVVEHIYDSSSGKFVPVTNTQHSMHVDEEVSCVNDASDQVITLEENKDSEDGGHEMITHHYTVELSGNEHLIETQEESVERDSNTVITGSEVIIRMDKDADKNSSAPDEKIQEADNFTVPALSLQEIVDNNNLSFEENLSAAANRQTEKSGPHSSHQPVGDDAHGSLSVSYTVETEHYSSQSSQDGSTIYVVTETELQALNDKKC
ncbi:hypothetical protein Btru_005992 [Bulinus truncatus]|nr:hypothetical protein Btru_005992 [Bulinus truncatus]